MKLKNKPNNHKWDFEAIGTQWSIETYEPLSDNLRKQISERIETYDRIYSRFRSDSLVSKIAQTPGEYEFPDDAQKLFEFYRRLYDLTDGAVSPLVGRMLEQAGYNKEYSLQPGEIRDVPKWEGSMQWLGDKLMTYSPLVLDFGAAGKGYLIDLVAQILEHENHTQYVIDASGDIRVRGSDEIIGLENPHDTEAVIGTVRLKDASLCASATNRRAWSDWHHIVDPRTKKPVNEIVATWVIAPTTLEADGLATALFFVNADRLAEWNFEYVRLDQHGHLDHSPGFMGELFI